MPENESTGFSVEKDQRQDASARKKAKDVLQRHFEDRITAKQSDFVVHGEKVVGESSGYVAKKQTDQDGLPFMIKVAKKSGTQRNDRTDTFCFVNEFITAPFYKRTLYDRTPVIEGVEQGAKSSEVSLRSRFLHEFETIDDIYDREKQDASFKSYLKDAEGAEKLFASMLAWGEFDMNGGNIGVMKITDGAGREKKVFAKIDHGWSGSNFFDNPLDMLESFANALNAYKIKNVVSLDISKFKKAFDEIARVSDVEIEDIVRARIYKLKQMGFDIKGLKFYCWKNDIMHSNDLLMADTLRFKTFDELEQHYISNFKRQRAVVKEASKKLDLISKIPVSIESVGSQDLVDRWESGGWLQVVRGENPFLFAAKYLSDDGHQEFFQSLDADNKAQALFYKGNYLFDSKDYIKAYSVFKNLFDGAGYVEWLDKSGENNRAKVLSYSSDALFELGKHEESAQTLFSCGKVLFELGRLKDAAKVIEDLNTEAYFRGWLDKSGENNRFKVSFLKGQVLCEVGDYRKAAEFLGGLCKEPIREGIIYKLERFFTEWAIPDFYKQQDLKRIEAVLDVLAKNKNNDEVLGEGAQTQISLTKGRFFYKHGRTEEAILEFEKNFSGKQYNEFMEKKEGDVRFKEAYDLVQEDVERKLSESPLIQKIFPHECFDPITGGVFKAPVVASDGYLYENNTFDVNGKSYYVNDEEKGGYKGLDGDVFDDKIMLRLIAVLDGLKDEYKEKDISKVDFGDSALPPQVISKVLPFFINPVNGQLFKTPVTASDGLLYEKGEVPDGLKYFANVKIDTLIKDNRAVFQAEINKSLELLFAKG